MIVWIWTNAVLTLLVLSFVRLNTSAPHRLRFFASLVALCGWLVPWGLVGGLVQRSALAPVLLPDRLIPIDSVLFYVSSDSARDGTMAIVWNNAATILLAATAFGLLLFGYASLRYVRFVRRISSGSVSGSHLWSRLPWETFAPNSPKKPPMLRIQQHEPGAVTTGIFSPTIWIHQDLVRHRDLGAALAHEYRHVRNHDNAYLWLITLIERLLWWNPLVRYLGSRTRRLQELSCDESCANDLANYRDMLKRLVLTSSTGSRQPCPQTPCIHHSKNFNVQRLRVLEGRYLMKTRHYLSTGLLLLGSSITLSFALAQDTPNPSPTFEKPPEGASVEEIVAQIEERTGEDIGPITGFSPGTTLEQAERIYRDLKVYVALIERQFAKQEVIIQELEQELEALRGPQVVENQASEQ